MGAADSDKNEHLKTAVVEVRDEVPKFGGGEREGACATTFSDDPQSPNVPQGYEKVFAKGSIVCRRQKGRMAVDVKIIEPIAEPEIFDGELLYLIEVSRKSSLARQLTNASCAEPSADAYAWSCAWWNRRTQMYEEPPDDENGGESAARAE